MRVKPYPGYCDQPSPTRPVIQQGFVSYQVNTCIHLENAAEFHLLSSWRLQPESRCVRFQLNILLYHNDCLLEIYCLTAFSALTSHTTHRSYALALEQILWINEWMNELCWLSRNWEIAVSQHHTSKKINKKLWVNKNKIWLTYIFTIAMNCTWTFHMNELLHIAKANAALVSFVIIGMLRFTGK